ncbi:MAG: hypothetical protein M1832_002334 [Thelocarpon impressellum]|nr:MAG: hypothetical protein M1832_002334 [Thelocarpon impressellum]
MPGDEYATSTGGTLKLKGVQDGKVDKKKKKKKKKKEKEKKEPKPTDEVTASAEGGASASTGDDGQDPREGPVPDPDREASPGAGKTEAQRRHDELRRKRLNERIKREGVKSHKERVEDLNRYLSNLSEHHDMPRIGPG